MYMIYIMKKRWDTYYSFTSSVIFHSFVEIPKNFLFLLLATRMQSLVKSLSSSWRLRSICRSISSQNKTRFRIWGKNEQPKAQYYVDETKFEEVPKKERSVMEIIMSGRQDYTKQLPLADFSSKYRAEPGISRLIEWSPHEKQAGIARLPLADKPHQNNRWSSNFGFSS